MFTFGWLTVTAEDLAVWEQFPNAAFTLVQTATATDAGEEFRLGAFELQENPSLSASGRSASATNAPSAICVTQPASSHETPSASEASAGWRSSASAASHSLRRNASLAVRIRCRRPSLPRTPTL